MKHQWGLYILSLVVSDLLALGTAFRLAYWLRFELEITRQGLFKPDVFTDIDYYQRLTFWLAMLWLLVFLLSGLYSRKNLLSGPVEYEQIFRASTAALLFVVMAGFLRPELIIARGWLVLAWSLSFLLVALGRFSLRRGVYRLRRWGFFVSPALIVGTNEEAVHLAQQLHNKRNSGLKLVGFIDDQHPVGVELEAPFLTEELCVLGRVSDLEALVDYYGVQEIILASSSPSTRDNLLDIFRIYGVSDKVHLRLSSGLYEIITTGLTVREFAQVPLVEVNQVRLTGIDNLLKIVLDYGIALPLVLLLSPLLLLIALAVRLDSPGPIIYRRRVLGVNGVQFDAYKFRTMRIDGDAILNRHPELLEELARTKKLKNDPRLTRLGSLLRRASLDELPQLFNVLQYQMSLVGPRMIHPEEVREYQQFGINLLTVRPGITGMWQVSGRSDLTYTERVRLDMHYIRNWSIWLDLQILFQTLPAVLRGKGAY